ncbi:MAG TPA: ChaN family lipoprotein [Polyangiaceae bacterium]|nr:ChaN family lipoprotein [Polyangiaceae bacterium]
MAILATCLPCACASGTEAPRAPTSSAVPSTSAAERWLTQLDREQVPVGKIWDVSAGAFVTEPVLAERVAKARFVLLGERHDNPDHHRLQARVVQQLVRAGRHPALVLEMLEPSQQDLADRYLATPNATAAGFGPAVGWEKTSWPPFSEYQPIFEAAFAGKLAVVAGNLAQADVKALVKQGASALGGAREHELGLDQPFPEALQAPLLDELRASHCGQLPEELLPSMALAQRARDAQLAKSMLAVAATDGAVLIAGGGHARLDRAVPRYLAAAAPGSTVVSISLREVRHGQTDPSSYAAPSEEGPFDYVWFTPRGTDEDPCASFHHPKQ